jgi:LemA protein
MKKSTRTMWITVFVLVVILLAAYNWFKTTNNSFVALEENVTKSWADVENVLQRRLDLIPNLVNTVKGYATHEQTVLTAVTDARSRVGSAQTIPDKMNANRELTSALGRLLVVMENYPNLKADQSFLSLQSQLEGTENRIAVERRRYNEAVNAYNIAIRSFPGSILASLQHLQRKVPFEADAAAAKAPQVKF